MRSLKKKADQGYRQGFQRGYNKGYDDGYNKGLKTAIAARSHVFTGTSIIIPTYNKLHYLQQCIESIVAHTNHPYELILVDNGSTDKTVEYLRSLSGQVQVKLNAHNLGFAGAVNQGLFMAKGTTLLILNNDAVVTENWLENLLTCVNSDQSIGIVAPVTNYISGEQLLEVHYNDMATMHEFARSYNKSNPGLWTDTIRLTGFCMLFRRDVFARLGYFDEGFAIGNCEDDDYGLRVRLLGLRLIIAKDTFIHHYGSVSMKALQGEFDHVYEKNLQYYSEKWREPHAVVERAQRHRAGHSETKTIDFYPSHVVVRAAHTEVFWIEHGYRYLIVDGESLEAVRVSQIDLEGWPVAGTISYDDYRERYDLLSAAQSAGLCLEGVIVQKSGERYQIEHGRWRHITSDLTYVTWFRQRPAPHSEVDDGLVGEEGAPIIAPIIIKADDI